MKNKIIAKTLVHSRKAIYAVSLSIILFCTGCKKNEEKLFFSDEAFAERAEEIANETDDDAIETSVSMTANVTPTIPAEIYVDVCGAVKKPGVYRLNASARVFEAIELAGGYNDDAAVSYINRAGVLSDGQQIYIPTQEEVEQNILPLTENMENSDTTEINSNDMWENRDDGRININSATMEELTTLTGIGESKARAIIAYREENGSFSSVEEITNVPGIKGGTYDKIKDGITIE